MSAGQPLLQDQPAWPGEPTVQRLARALRARLLAGVWVDDEPLPSLRQVASREGVSLATVQRAVDVLVGEGLLRAEPRRVHRPALLDFQQRREAALAALHAGPVPALHDAAASGLSPQVIDRLVHEIGDRLRGQPRAGQPGWPSLLEGPGLGTVRRRQRRTSSRTRAAAIHRVELADSRRR
ncbi:MAG: GntR family transcriptional regulator [Candidatus Latescibacterota bacterium]